MGGNELIASSAFKGTRKVGLHFLTCDPSDLPSGAESLVGAEMYIVSGIDSAVPSVNSELIETKLVLRRLP